MMDHGYVSRDYEKHPVGYCSPTYQGEVYDRSDWPDLISAQQKNQSSPLDVHKFNDVPILNQTTWKYCWMFAIVAGVMNRYAFQGINDPVSELSATAVAAQGKNYRNKGGYCSEAVEYVQKFGIPEASTWPNNKSGRSYSRLETVKESSKRSNIVQFEDIGQGVDKAISALISPDPAPVTFSLRWWRHAILGLSVSYRKRRNPLDLNSYRLNFVNSYGPRYEQNGFGKLAGTQMVADEYIVIRRVKVKSDDS